MARTSGLMRPSKLRLPREHRRGDQVVLVDRLGDLGRKRARVADAGRAAVADQVEAKLVEIRLQAGVVQIVGDHLRSRRQARLDPGLGGKAALDGFLGEQAGGHHHRRV